MGGIKKKNFEIATRAQVVTLRSVGISAKRVEEITGVAERTQRKIVEKAKERGFSGGKILDAHVKDGDKSGRPRKDAQTQPNVEGDTDVSVNKEVEPLRPDEAHRVIETQNRSMDAADTAYNQSQSLFEQLIQAQHPNSASSNDRPPN